MFFLPRLCRASPEPRLSITGLVRNPLHLTMDQLNQFQSIEVQLNEVMENGSYRGVFYYRGVPLRTLMGTASVQKEGNAFPKNVDLAILIRNREGKQVALSWGEVFYKNPGRILVATSARPIVPHRDCRACHTPDEYRQRLDQLYRKIKFPKLVMCGDGYADRCLEEISSIEVIDLSPGKRARKMQKLFSPEFTVTGRNMKTRLFSDLSGLPRQSVRVKHLGEGTGYHGINVFEGVPFKAILDRAGVKRALNLVFLVSAPDGYRSLFSYGELFLDPLGERVTVADKMEGRPLTQGGRFFLIPPDDLMADRDVKAVQKIEVISLKGQPKI